jgi:hypothetical protein
LADFKQINFDVLTEIVFVKVASQFIVLLVGITEEDDGFGIGQFELQKNVFHFYWIITVTLSSDDLFD